MTPPVRRVLVALDASAPSRAALEAAAVLAGRGGGEIVALYVEDEDLLRLAALPCAVAFPGSGGAPCALDPVLMERELRDVAERARRLAEEVTRRMDVRIRFRWARGRVVAEILAAARDADLVVLGRRTRRSSRTALGSTARSVASAGGAVLLLDAEDALVGPVLVVIDGTDAGRVALDLALALARRLDGGRDGTLRVVAVPDAAGHTDAAVAAVAAAVARAGSAAPAPTVHVVRRRDPDALGAAASILGAHTTVLPLSLVGDAGIERWVAAAPGPVVVVGAAAPEAEPA